MSNPTLEGMVRVYETRILAKGPFSPTEPMRETLLWLADNVTDEMRDAFWREWEKKGDNQTVRSISAALRAAAGSAPTTPEVK